MLHVVGWLVGVGGMVFRRVVVFVGGVFCCFC